jgi:uncharacterized protein YecE (DUF72 family)
MKFGKIENIDHIDFTLPSEPEQNKLIDFDSSNATNLYLGGTGWSMPEWKGTIYPIKTKPADYLYHYSRQFNAIELNSTHYALPKIETINKWKTSVPIDFKFCPKIWKNISHRKNLGIGTGLIEDFCERMCLFETNLGPTFLQLPPYFGFDRIDQLEQCLANFPSGFEIAVEARHESFFSYKNVDIFFNLLTQYNAIALITDVAGRRDIIHSRLTYKKTMVRWVGNGLHHSDYSRLEEWRIKILTWLQYAISEIYFFPHQPDNLLTPQISSYFYKLFDGEIKLNSRAPRISNQNEQLNLF